VHTKGFAPVWHTMISVTLLTVAIFAGVALSSGEDAVTTPAVASAAWGWRAETPPPPPPLNPKKAGKLW
jgi:hypothetical protein